MLKPVSFSLLLWKLYGSSDERSTEMFWGFFYSINYYSTYKILGSTKLL